jgi:hypothetical protein
MTQLTEHFSIEEFTDSQTAARNGVRNAPNEGSPAMANLLRTAEVMEKVRTILYDKPVLISSGYRSPRLNTMVGGSRNSAHTHGLACDFTCPGFGTPLAVCLELEGRMVELGIDQLIYEFMTWVHLGLSDKPRHQTLTIDTRGTRTGLG